MSVCICGDSWDRHATIYYEPNPHFGCSFCPCSEWRPKTSNISVEFCIMLNNQEGVHRGPWSEEECLDWLAEAEADGCRPGAFFIASRTVSEWKKGYPE